MLLLYILLFTTLGSILSLFGSLFLLLKEEFTQSFSQKLISFAAGTLIATALLNLLPEAVEKAGNNEIFIIVLLGFVSFFLAERFLTMFHFHHSHNGNTTNSLIIIGDGVHNFIDGITIAAAFIASVPLGITTSLAVAVHEIPQEIADMGVLLANGLSKKKALIYNFLSALTALFGALLALYFASFIEQYVYVFLALAAGHFIYISASDLIPEIHEKTIGGTKGINTLIFFLGILVVLVFGFII